MELNQFISETIKSLISAINESTEFAEQNGAIVNPIIMENEYESTIWRKDKKDGRRFLTRIDFDVAVTASSEDDKNLSGGLKIQVLNLGASKRNTELNQKVSRIQFNINVALPHQGDK